MTLSVSQMTLMSRLLEEALPLDDAARRVWLERLSPEYRELAPALSRSLLPDDAQAARVEALASLPKFGAGAPNDTTAPSAFEAGSRMGPYELLRRLGAGGMAEVWLARRADGALKREVALKLPLLALSRTDIEQRFIRERDIVASLEHVNIARLYDAGVANGSPFLSMEYVQGLPLTDWCSSRRLGVTQRLELFLQVLEAVRYAHDKQVLHRDLKPSNILVMEPGQVRLLDFGVAKLLEGADSDLTRLTSVHGRALTPDYASPELLRGDNVDVRSDVYSLGVLLYELLTGERPYRLKSAASMGMLEHAIAALEVKKPSTLLEEESDAAARARVAGAGVTADELRGDLDAVTLKALARDPALRYASVSELATDVRRYLKHEPVQARSAGALYRARKFAARHRAATGFGAFAAVLLLGLAGQMMLRDRLVSGEARPASTPLEMPEAAARAGAGADMTPFNPPPHSIAVLPFVNLSGDKKQEYFSDGLTEELLNSLARINELQVAARTSSFYFSGKQVELGTIARRLNVASVLEGSVRRSGHKVRITAQLSNAVNGFHLWSQTYDRDLGDVLQLQTEIAEAVAAALQVALLGDVATKIEVGGTHSPDAFDAYLRASKANRGALDKQGLQTAIAGYTEAIRLDPAYATAYADRSLVRIDFARNWAEEAEKRDYRRDAQADAGKAAALAPNLAGAHLALAYAFEDSLAFTEAVQEFERALALEPGNAKILRHYGWFALLMGRTEVGLAAVRRSVELDPLNTANHFSLGRSLVQARRYTEAIAAFKNLLALDPDDAHVTQWLGMAYYEGGDFQSARPLCEKSRDINRPFCLALVYDKLGMRTDAETNLKAWQAGSVNGAASVAMIYSQWGDTARALESLETAVRLRDPLLERLKVNDLLDPLRKEPRFQAIERELKFPE